MSAKLPTALKTTFMEAKGFLQDEKVNEARQLLNSVDKSEKYFEYHVLMARAAFIEESFDLSLAHLNQALVLDSTSAALRIKAASLQLKLEPDSKPIELVDEALAMTKIKQKDIFQAVRLYNKMSEPQKSLEILQKNILRMPNDQTARYALARQLVNSQKFDEAISELNNSLALNSASEKTRILLARILMLEGELQKSRVTITPLLAINLKDEIKNKVLLILADIAIRSKEYNDSRNYLAKVSTTISPYYNYLWGKIFEQEGNFLNTVNSFNASLAALKKDTSLLSDDTDKLDELSLRNRANELDRELQPKIYQFSVSEDEEDQEVDIAESILD